MSNRAFYDADVATFLCESADTIIGKITQKHSQELIHQQTGAWANQIEILHSSLQNFTDGHLLFEVLIPRMGRRVDAVLIYKNILNIRTIVRIRNGHKIISCCKP